MDKGDAVFFNPALFHAAGENTTTDDRSANLLQISSAFGKPMESVNASKLVGECWEMVLKKHADSPNSLDAEALIAALAEGYPFPTNLDQRPPGSDGMAPKSEQDVLRQALHERWDTQKVIENLHQLQCESAMS